MTNARRVAWSLLVKKTDLKVESDFMKRVFIVGAPRSGSTWTGFLLSHHPQVVTLHHAVIFPYLMAMEQWLQVKGSSYVTHATNSEKEPDRSVGRLENLIAPEELYRLLERVADQIFAMVAGVAPDCSVIIDKTPENVRMAPSIHRIMPDAYFLHIVRDPRAVFCSQRSASKSWANGEFPTRPCDGGLSWQRDVEAGMRIADFSERFLQVRYEDLREGGAAEIERIFSWLDLETTAELCDDALQANSKQKMTETGELPVNFVRKSSDDGWQAELSDSHARTIEYVVGDTMEKLSYPLSQPIDGKPFAVTRYEYAERLVAKLERISTKLHRAVYQRLIGRAPPWQPKLRIGESSDPSRGG